MYRILHTTVFFCLETIFVGGKKMNKKKDSVLGAKTMVANFELVQ